METEKVIRRQGEFSIPSSITPQTPEVKSMIEQVEHEGRATPLYEFVQGMVDYGRNNNPPPRIYMVLENGQKQEYRGEKDLDLAQIKAIEFTNSGSGLAPEEASIFRHGGDEDTLGQHGRGSKIAMAYLAFRGMPVEIESNYGGQAWRAVTSLEDTHTGLSKTLTINGGWEDRESNQTTFRVLEPNKNFTELLATLPDYFIYANPNYNEAVVVGKNKDVRPPKVSQIFEKAGGRVQCLEDVVDWDSIPDRYAVFVDGLRVSNRSCWSSPYLLPWAIDGMRDAEYGLRVARSHDSSKTDGDPRKAIEIAIFNCTDKNILEKFLDSSVRLNEADDNRAVPAELSYYGTISADDLNIKTKEILLSLWQKKFGDAYLVSDWHTKTQIMEKHADFQEDKLVVVKGRMFEMLKLSGVKTADQALGITEKKEIHAPKEIEVEYAKLPHAVERFLEEAVEANAGIRLVQKDGRKALVIELPHYISTEDDFYDRKKPAMNLARVAAVVSSAQKLNTQVMSRKGTEKVDITYDINEKYGRKGFYVTTLNVVKSEAPSLSEQDFPNGLTKILLEGELLQRMNPPLEEQIQAKVKELRERKEQQLDKKAKLPVLGKTVPPQVDIRDAQSRGPSKKKPNRQSSRGQSKDKLSGEPLGASINRRDFLKFGLGAAAVVGATALINNYGRSESISDILRELRLNGLSPSDNELRRVRTADESRSVINQPDFRISQAIKESTGVKESVGTERSFLGVHEIAYGEGKKPLGDFELSDVNGHPEGYYREFVGTTAKLNSDGRMTWIQPGVNAQEKPVSSLAPDQYQMSMRFAINGEKRVPIREGEEIIAVVSDSPVELLEEARSGQYILRGFSDQVKIFTARNDRRDFKSQQPWSEESSSLVNLGDLRSDWQLLLARIKSDAKLSLSERAGIILKAWGENYTYSDDSKLDDQVIGDSVTQVMSQVINTQRGICNTAASGYVALLHLVDVPARVVVGKSIDSLQRGAGHMWAEFWDGMEWRPVETLRGSADDRRRDYNNIADSSGSDLDYVFEGSLSDPDGNTIRSSQAKIIKYQTFLDDIKPPSVNKIATTDRQRKKSDTRVTNVILPPEPRGLSFDWSHGVTAAIGAAVAGFYALIRRKQEVKQFEDKEKQKKIKK